MGILFDALIFITRDVVCDKRQKPEYKQLLDDLKDRRRYWKWEEPLGRARRTRFGIGYGFGVRQTVE